MPTTPTDGSPLDSELAERCRTLLAEASELFRRGEIAASAKRALEASGVAGSAMRPDLLAEAALVVDGVPDPSTAAAVDRMCSDALAAVGADEIAVRAQLHGQLAVALHLRERLVDSQTHVEAAVELAAQAHDPLATAAALHARQLSIAGPGSGARAA